MASNVDDVYDEIAEDEKQEGADNDDEDDDDFVPGGDDDTDDEDGNSDDDFDDTVSFRRGSLSLDEQQRLCFEGDGFRLKSSSPLEWNFLDINTKPTRNSLTFTMDGTCDVSLDSIIENRSSMKKPTYRKFEVTSSSKDDPSSNLNLKKDDDDEDTNGSNVSVVYRFYGHQLLPEPSESENILEFNGSFSLANGKADTIGLECEFRSIPYCGSFATGTSTAFESTSASKFAEKADDDLEEDDTVDYDELIALHEDAASSVDAIRKRYRNDVSSSAEEPLVKKGKSTSDNEDDDIGF